MAYERVGRLDRALEIYTRGASQFSDYTDFAIEHAPILLYTGHAEAAWQEIKPILTQHSGLADARIVAVEAALATAHLEAARTLLEEGLDLSW
ncbi:MAG: hypothetical protein H7222_12105 [Methylotenera sp.]|nr:hypothetical protein [Oligoflexia bacterium]